MQLNLIECGSKLPVHLSIFGLAHSLAKPAGSGPSAAREFPLLARFLPCFLENVFIAIARRRQSNHP